MAVVSVFISLMLLMLSLKLTKGVLKNPFVLYYSLWTGILFLSAMGLYNIYTPSDNTYMLITLMNVCFFFGALVKLPKRKQVGISNANLILNDKLIIGLVAINLLVQSVDFANAVRALLDGTPWWQVRQMAYAVYDINTNSDQLLMEIFNNVIRAPFTDIIVPITAYLLFNEPKKKITKILIVQLMVSTVLSSIAGGGGRLGYIYIIECFILAFLWFGKGISKAFYKKYKKKIWLLAIASVSAIIVVTSLRVGVDAIFKQIYTYFALSPTLLDVNLEQLKNSEHTYGMLTLFGIHSYFFRALDIIGLSALVPEVYYKAYEYILNANLFKQVGFGTANSFVSPVYYFYLDGGASFVGGASFAFGVIISNIYHCWKSNMNIKNFCYYILVMNAIFLTFMRIQTTIPSYIISFFMVSFLFKSGKIQINGNHYK